VFAMLAFIAVPAMAANNWDGNGDWTDDAAANWSTATIPNNESARIRSGTVSIDTDVIDFGGSLYLGHIGGGTAGNSALDMSGGSLSALRINGFGDASPTVGAGFSTAVTLSGTADVDLSGPGDYWMLYYGGARDDSCCTTASASLTMSDSATLDVGSFVFGAKHGPEAASNTFDVLMNGGVLTVEAFAQPNNEGTKSFGLNGGTVRILGDVSWPFGSVTSGIGGTNLGGGLDSAYSKSYDGTYTSFVGIPEPTTLTLLGLGGFVAFLVSGCRRRRR